jgi:hypothetical protein
MALPQHLAEFERRVASRLADAVEEMRRSLHAKAESASSQLLSELESFRPEMPQRLLEETELRHLERPSREEARHELARELKSALAALDAATTQGEALDALLAAARGGGRAAVWITQPDALVAWGSTGFGSNGRDPLSGTRLAWNLSPALERLAQGRGTVRLGGGDAARLASELQVDSASAAAFVPLVLRDRLAAALYVDSNAGELELERLQLLAHATAQRLELQALSSRAYSPTLVLDEEAPAGSAGLPLWSSDDVAADAPAEPAAAPFPPSTTVAVPPHTAAQGFATAPPVLDEPADAAFAPVGTAYPEFELESSPEPAPVAIEPEPAPRAERAPETMYEPAAAFDVLPESPTDEEPSPVVDFGLPVLDAAPTERFVIAPESARTTPFEVPATTAEATAAEIAWELEETGSVTPDAPAPEPPPALARPIEEAATGQIPQFRSPEPPLPPLREIRVDSLIHESTAEFIAPPPRPATTLPPSFAATQAIRTGGIATHEFPLPSAEPAETTADLSDEATVLFRREPPAPLAARPTVAVPSEDATILIRREPAAPLAPSPTVAIPIAPPAPLAPIAAATPNASVDDEPTIAKSKTTEVAPPPDVQGPGWAFTAGRTQRSTGENALHEEARRLARLLISEIKLYNEEQVEEGRRNRDVYHRLKDDIDRSRQIYEERIHDSVRGATDYFQQELVRSLAGGDARALGI